MTANERLALAVRAEVAQVRADAAQERADIHDKIVGPYMQIVEMFNRKHGRHPNYQSAADRRILLHMLTETGAADITFEQIEAAMMACTEARQAQDVAVQTINAMLDAWRQDGKGGTVFDWVDVPSKTFEAALQEALTATP